MRKFIIALLAAMMLATPTTAHASLPPSVFGAQNGGAVHMNPQGISGSTLHFAGNNSFTEGERIGVLTVPRLNRVVNVYEGETLRNMDFGAGRFSFTGANWGNTALIGHNRGSNGFFSFVRHLQDGDILTLDMNGITRTYAVISVFIIDETDLTSLMDFRDTRLTLVTCVEYRPQYRRVAKLLEV